MKILRWLRLPTLAKYLAGPKYTEPSPQRIVHSPRITRDLFEHDLSRLQAVFEQWEKSLPSTIYMVPVPIPSEHIIFLSGSIRLIDPHTKKLKYFDLEIRKSTAIKDKNKAIERFALGSVESDVSNMTCLSIENPFRSPSIAFDLGSIRHHSHHKGGEHPSDKAILGFMKAILKRIEIEGESQLMLPFDPAEIAEREKPKKA